MLLWKLSLTFQPGMGHCSTRKVRPRAFASLQQRHEYLLEHHEVGVHGERGVAADEAGDRVGAEQHGGVEHAQHERVLALRAPRRPRASMLSK